MVSSWRNGRQDHCTRLRQSRPANHRRRARAVARPRAHRADRRPHCPLESHNPEHGRLEFKVAALLNSVVGTQNLGLIMVGEVGIFMRSNPDRVRGADVIFISHEQYERRPKTRGFLDIAPELVVEILSPERPDSAQKVVEYLAIGVRLVLVVDPDARTVAAHRPNGTVAQYGEDDVVPCDDALPGFRLPVADVM